jgi:hypothetical protein
MTKTIVGETMHFLATGLTYLRIEGGPALGAVSKRGEELFISQDMLDANTDRAGECVFKLLHDPEGQMARFGRVMFAPGPAPADLLLTEPGTVDHEQARARERQAAYRIADQTSRNEALRTIAERYGAAPTTSRTMATFGERS